MFLLFYRLLFCLSLFQVALAALNPEPEGGEFSSQRLTSPAATVAERAKAMPALKGSDLSLYHLFTDFFYAEDQSDETSIGEFKVKNLEMIYAAYKGENLQQYQALCPLMIFERPVVLTEALCQSCWHGRTRQALRQLLALGEETVVQIAAYPVLWAPQVEFIPLIAFRGRGACTVETASVEQLDVLGSMGELECAINLISPSYNPLFICEGMNPLLKRYALYLEQTFHVIPLRLMPYYNPLPPTDLASKLRERRCVKPSPGLADYFHKISLGFIQTLEEGGSAPRSVDVLKQIADILYHHGRFFGAKKLYEEMNALHPSYMTGETLYTLGRMHYAGEGIDVDFLKARYYWERGAEAEDSASMVALAVMLDFQPKRKENLSLIRTCLAKAADLNNPDGCFLWGMMNYLGKAFPADLDTAWEYLNKAADLGHREAAFQFAIMNYKGEGKPKDLKTARTYFGKASDLGHAESNFYLGKMWQEGTEGDQNLVRARAYFEQAAERGDLNGALYYGMMCGKGEGGPQDLPQARAAYKKASDLGHVGGTYRFAYMCAVGEGGPQDLLMARAYAKKGADCEDFMAAYLFAQMCDKGVGGEQDLMMARQYYKKAADGGSSIPAIVRYAEMCVRAEGGPQDLEAGRAYYQKAADLGDGTSAFYFAVMAYCGEGGEENHALAKTYYKKGADVGHSHSYFNLALMCAKGEGGPQDMTMARECYKKGADLGEMKSAYNFAQMCEEGAGGDRDLDLALTYYQLAADRGHRDGAFAFAQMCDHGDAGEQNLVVARMYYQLAAELGDAEGALCFAQMCEEGEGGEKDLALAYRYYQWAAALGEKDLAPLKLLHLEKHAS